MFKNIKIPHIDFLPLIILSFIFLKIINNIGIISHGFSVLFSYVSAFIWGFGFAYLINPLMKYIEKKFKLKRSVSLLISYIIVIGFFTLLVTIVTPTIIDSVKDLFNSMPTYISKTEESVTKFLNKNEFLSNNSGIRLELDNAINNFNSFLIKFVNSGLPKGINTVFSTAVNFTSRFVNAIFGLMVSIYMLKDKEMFINNIKRFLYAIFKEDFAHNLISNGREIDFIFSKYIIGKFIDSLIIGIMCFVGLTILKAPYAALLSLIVGITNMIPYFGPFIGMIPATLITLIYNPLKALWVLIFIILLQQFDGWYLGPKILGSQVGLNPFWIILAIMLGGGMFGVIGMFLGVPVMAVIKTFMDRFITKRLNSKNIKDSAIKKA